MSETKNSQYNKIDYEDFSSEEDEETYTFFEFLDEMTKDVDKGWETLTRYLRINGNKIEPFAGSTEGGHCQNGIVITKYENGYSIEDITSENKEVKLSSFSEFDKDGNLTNGYVNCFALGYISIDKGYVQELFSGFIYNKNQTDNWEWDKVS